MTNSPECRAAIAVLGKALSPSNEVTFDFATRLAGLFFALSAEPNDYADAIFVGGGPEHRPAESAVGYATFQQRFLPRLPSPTVRFEIEDRSRNTIENITNLARMVAGRGFSRVDLLSSDYHIDRLETIDRLLPQQSLLRRLGHLRGRTIRVPLLLPSDNDPCTELKAEVFRAVDSLNAPRVNLEAIVAGVLPGWCDGAEQHLAHSFTRLHRLVRRAEELRMASTFIESLRSAIQTTGKLADSVAANSSPASEARLDRSEASAMLQSLNAEICFLRGIANIDRPVQPDDWPAIERVACDAITANAGRRSPCTVASRRR